MNLVQISLICITEPYFQVGETMIRLREEPQDKRHKTAEHCDNGSVEATDNSATQTAGSYCSVCLYCFQAQIN